MKDYIILILAALLLAFDFGLSKLYQSKAGTSLKAGFFFNAVIGVFTAVIFWCIGGFSFHLSLYSILMAALLSTLGMSYTLFGFRILRSGSMALYTLFLMVGGMTVPYVWGLIFLNEEFSIIRTVGLAILILAVAVSNMQEKGSKTNKLMMLMCLAVFFLNGFVSVVSKMHQVESVYETVSAAEFVMLSGIFKFIFGGIAFLVVSHREKKMGVEASTKAPKVMILSLIAVSAVISGVSYLFQLMGAENLPATVLYPFMTGGSMVGSTLVGIIAFKEKPSRAVIIGVCLSFIATLMFL